MTAINWLDLNWIDYTILGIILISLLIGVVRGFICEVISLITWIVALALAFKYASVLATHFAFIKSQTGAYALAFGLIFVVILIIGITINVLVQQLWHRTGMPVADRLLGLLLGIARGIVIIAFILLFVSASPLQEEPVVKKSQFIPLFKPVVVWLRDILPEKITQKE